MLKKLLFAYMAILFILITCSCTRSSSVVYLDINKIIVYDNLNSACCSGKSTGKSITDIVEELGDNFITFEDSTICLKAIKRKEKLVTSHGVSDVLIDIYEIPDTQYFLRISK